MPELPKEKLFDAALKILPGLLASGHYTFLNDSLKEHYPDVHVNDFGEGSYGAFARKYPHSAILDAIELAQELHDQVYFVEQK